MPAVPTAPDFTDGIVDSSFLNRLVAAIQFTQAVPKAKATQSAAQALATGSNTSITFDAAAIDTHGMWNAGLPSRLTAQYTGYYLLGGGIAFASNSTSYRLARWTVNGTVLIDGNVLAVPSAAGVATRVAARTTIAFLVEGDYVELQASHAVGAPLNTGTSLGDSSSASVVYLGQ